MAMPVVPTASFTVFLCIILLLFTSSSARSPLIDDTIQILFPESDTNNLNGPHTILLPSDSESDSVPFTIVTVRPLRPGFPRRPFPLSYHFHHRCRHSSHRFKPFNPPLPFSDDHDITFYDADETVFDLLPSGGARQRWTRLRHVEPSFSHEPSKERREEITKPQEQDQTQPQREEKGVMKKIRKFLDGF